MVQSSFADSGRSRNPLAGVAAMILAALLLPALMQDTSRSEDAPAEAKPAETKAETKAESKPKPAVEEKGDKKPEEKKADDKKADEPAKEAKGEKDAPEAKPAAGGNLIGDLLKRVFGGAKPAAPGIAPAAMPARPGIPAEEAKKGPANGDATARDHIDARAPHDPTQARRLKQAKKALDDKNWRAAIDILQTVLDQPQDTLIRNIANGKWASVRGEAHRMLGTLPADGRDLYELQFGPVARQLLNETNGPDGQGRLLEASTRYFHTKAGQQAADQLVGLACDEGQYGLAARWIRELISTDADCVRAPRWKLKAAFALHQAGDTSLAEKLLTQLKAGDEPFRIQVGEQPLAAADWMKSLARNTGLGRPQGDWPIFLGNTSRTGTVSGGEPLLLARWTVPLTSSRPVQEQIQTLSEDLSDLKRATIPAMVPLMVDGKVIFRTLRGFTVADVQTGQVLWETRAGVSAEQLLGGVTPNTGDSEVTFRFGRQMFVQDYGGQGAGDNHPLTSLLYRDANYGLAASDGRRLYVVEDLAILSRQEMNYGGMWWGGWQQPPDPFNRDWTSNKLTAYDLKSGRPMWDTGGEEMLEPFDLPLAGTFFLGTPLPDAGELFVVGEKDNEIRLHCLDGLTGRPQWSQLLGMSEAKIEQDIARRRWTAQVASRDGVVICPTTIGWLVAVDRKQRSILWAHRYSKPSANREAPQFQGVQMAQTGELNQQWAPSAPMISGHFVVYTPTEEPVLVCNDLHTGDLAWEMPKGESLYVAGIFNDRVVVVGKQFITGLDIATGKPAWKRDIPDADGRPAGFGVGDAAQYHLPLNSGQLWTLSLNDGTVLGKSYLPTGEPALGNLAMYRGLLLSLGSGGMTSFEQRAAIEDEITRRREKNPTDAWALLRKSDIALLKRDFPTALTELRQIKSDELSVSDRARYRRSVVESLAAVIRADFQKPLDAEIEELRNFVQSDDEVLLQRRLAAERLHARREFEAAFDAYLKLGEKSLSALVKLDGSAVDVRLELWLAGHLLDLWTASEGDDRKRLDERIAKLADEARNASPADRQKFATFFRFHAASLPIRRQVIEEWIAAGEFGRAEAELDGLRYHSDPLTSATATERLARLLVAQGLARDADVYYRELESRWADVKLSDPADANGKTAREIVAAWHAGGAARPMAPGDLSWGDVDLKLQRSPPANYMAQEDYTLSDGLSRLPFFQEHRIQISPNYQRLTIVRADNARIWWSVPLRSNARSNQGQFSPTKACGHLVYLIHRDVLHCLSPVERKVLWTRQIDNRGAASGYYRQSARWTPQALRPNLQNMFGEQSNAAGMLAVANSEYVAVYGRRTLTAVDATTGAVRWTRSEIPAGTAVVGTTEAVFVFLPDRVLALRAVDGREIESKLPGDLQSSLVQAAGPSLIVWGESGGRRIFGLGGRSPGLRSFHPLTGQESWGLEFPANTSFGRLNDEELVALRPDGRIDLVDVTRGVQRTNGQIEAADMKSRTDTFAFQDPFRLYLLVNSAQRNQNVYFGEELPTIHANGTIVAFDRTTGKMLWKEKVTGHQLVTSELTQSPVLTFIHRSLERRGNMGFWQSKLKILDKASGRLLIEAKSPNSNGYRALDVNMADRYLELRSYNERIRLMAVERASVDGPATAETPGEKAP